MQGTEPHERRARELLESLFDFRPPQGVFAGKARELNRAELERFLMQPVLIDLARVFLQEVERAWGQYSPRSGEGVVPLEPAGPESINHTNPGGVPMEAPQQLPVSQRPVFSTERNGGVGKEYRSRIRTAPEVEIVAVGVPEGIGLAFDLDTGDLHGVPTAAGEYSLTVRYRYRTHGSGDGRPLLDGACLLVINPDPQSLWLDQPSDRNAPDWKSDEDSAMIQGVDHRRMVFASKRGRSHAHIGSCRDDDAAVDTCGDWNLLAVADGAGSAKRSRVGSRLAVRSALETMRDKLQGPHGDELYDAPATMAHNPNAGLTPAYRILGAAAFAAMKAIEQESVATAHPIKDYSTTLILALHRHTGFGELIATFWVGDGAAAVYSREGRLSKLLGTVDAGDYAGQTRFLDTTLVSDSKEIADRIRVELVPYFDFLALMTDGITDPKFETDRNLASLDCWDRFADEVLPLLEDEQPDARLLSWLDFWSPGNHDDRTIAILW